MITARLQAIMDMVDTSSVADIGTDHAYIPIKLAQENRINKAVASDKNNGPIEIARGNVKKYGLEKIIELRCADGLSAIEAGETDTIIIAGMGGNLIGDILERDLNKAKKSKLILQPMNAQYELRKRLLQMGFKIIRENLAKEGFKIYNIIMAEEGFDDSKKEEAEFHIPHELLEHKLAGALIEKKKREFTKIYLGLKNSQEKNQEDERIINYCEYMLLKIGDMEKIYKENNGNK